MKTGKKSTIYRLEFIRTLFKSGSTKLVNNEITVINLNIVALHEMIRSVLNKKRQQSSKVDVMIRDMHLESDLFDKERQKIGTHI